MSVLYLVYVQDPPAPEPFDDPAAVLLDDGLELVRTDQTRSQLYHVVKRRLGSGKLLVALLQGSPKFKGMRPGAAKAARDLLT